MSTVKTYEGDLFAIIEQLEKCEYECQGGPLENNVAFIALKRMAAKKKDVFVCKECRKIHKKSMYCIAQNIQGHDVTFTCRCGKTKTFKGREI